MASNSISLYFSDKSIDEAIYNLSNFFNEDLDGIHFYCFVNSSRPVILFNLLL